MEKDNIVDKKEFINRCLSYYQTLIDNYDFGHKKYNPSGPDTPVKGFSFGSADEDVLNRLMELAINNMIKFEQMIEEKKYNVIETEDLVVLSMDNGPETRYYLSRYASRPLYPEPLNEYAEYQSDYTNLSVHNGLGRELLGKHVGDTLTYTDGEEKKLRTIKILSLRKTKYSAPLNDHELNADYDYKKVR